MVTNSKPNFMEKLVNTCQSREDARVPITMLGSPGVDNL